MAERAYFDETMSMIQEYAEPFWYDRQAGSFNTGEQYVAPDSTLFTVPTSVIDAPLVRVGGRSDDYIMMPRLHTFLQENLSEQLICETKDVIRETFARQRPELADITAPYHGSYRSFDVARSREDHPHLMLQTLGTCACLKVVRHGIPGDDLWDYGVARYAFHNVETREQKVSLLAGLGHVAYRALSL